MIELTIYVSKSTLCALLWLSSFSSEDFSQCWGRKLHLDCSPRGVVKQRLDCWLSTTGTCHACVVDSVADMGRSRQFSTGDSNPRANSSSTSQGFRRLGFSLGVSWPVKTVSGIC